MKFSFKKILTILVCVSVFSMSALVYPVTTRATGVATSATVQISNPTASTASDSFSSIFTPAGTTSIQCIKIVFATNADMSGGVPASLTTTSDTFTSVTGGSVTGTWSVYASAPNGTIQFEDNATTTTTAAAITAIAGGITNTSLTTFYAQITTYSTVTTHTCATPVDISNIIALETHAGLAATVTIQPNITFSIGNYAAGSGIVNGGPATTITTTATTIPFGTLTGGSTAAGSQTLTVTTNASNGYNLYISFVAAMTNGSVTFRADAGTRGSPGAFDGSSSQSSWGYTEDNTVTTMASNQWAGVTSSQVLFASATTAKNADVTHIEYQAEPATTQQSGSYTSTVLYDLAPSF